MYNRELYVEKIIGNLARIKSETSLRNSLYLYDINIHSEEFFKVLLNKVFNYNLENLNLSYALSESIDLGDVINGIAFQVTSSRSKKKIRETVQSFFDNESFKEYPLLKILVIGDKIKRSGQLFYVDWTFDLENDVIDISDLIKIIQGLEASKINEIADWMDSELAHNVNNFYTPPSQADFNRYFQKFLNTEVDCITLLLKAQPNIADCKEVFSNDYYAIIYQMYSMLYFSMLDNTNAISDKLRDKDVFRTKSSSFVDLEEGRHHLPGGMLEIKKMGALRPGKLQYHTISFTRGNSEHGISFKVWVFLNGRWVFFPKPWDLVKGISELREYKPLKVVARILRVFGFKNYGLKDQAALIAAIRMLNEQARKVENH